MEVSNSYDLHSITTIHSRGRKSPITRVLHAATWNYFTLRLSDHFLRSPKAVKEVIMTDINDLVQEFWRTSCDEAEASFFAMRRLLNILKVNVDIISVFATTIDLADKKLQVLSQSHSRDFSAQRYYGLECRAKIKILLDGCQKMLDQSLSKSKDLGDMLRFLPGVVVQKPMSMEGMAVFYRVKPDFLERLVKSSIEPLVSSNSRYILDDYLSSFLRNRDRSQLYYCDPKLQHISICRHILSLLDGSRVFDFRL